MEKMNSLTLHISEHFRKYEIKIRIYFSTIDLIFSVIREDSVINVEKSKQFR